MIYRVLQGLSTVTPFNTIAEAKEFADTNGGTVYIIEVSCKYGD